MRLYFYTIALLSVLISCNNKMTDYNTAIENCIQNRPETKQAGNPDSLIFWRPNPDCLPKRVRDKLSAAVAQCSRAKQSTGEQSTTMS